MAHRPEFVNPWPTELIWHSGPYLPLSTLPPTCSQLLVHRLTPVHRGQKDIKKAAEHSRLVGDRFNEQGNLHTRLIFGAGAGGVRKMSRSLHPFSRILKVYIQALTGFSHVYAPDGLNTLLSQGCVLGIACSMGKASRMHIPKIRAGVRSFQLPESSLQVNW